MLSGTIGKPFVLRDPEYAPECENTDIFRNKVKNELKSDRQGGIRLIS